MSVQFGRWKFEGELVDDDYAERAQPLLSPFGPDDFGCYLRVNIHILYWAFHTTKESRSEKQPFVTASGAVITWEGRLDNRDELLRRFSGSLHGAAPDAAIVAAAYERWGENCFATLTGDWALSIWEPHTRSLTLARDAMGVRQLYYALEDDQVTWCTLLDPLVLLSGRRFALCEEYIAGWFSQFPAAHLTPYIGIDSVPPASVVTIRDKKRSIQKYWDFAPETEIRYPSDSQYEEHFLTVFGEAVRSRLRSDKPILAELSGGVDSSSIVCMADELIAARIGEAPRLDTVSYYDDSEPHWNERPYFSKVEEHRGRIGHHIDVGSRATCRDRQDDRFFALPGMGTESTQASREFVECLSLFGSRVLLSGFAGDEVMGGVPNATPELAHLLVSGSFLELSRKLKFWALNQKRPWFDLLRDATRPFFPLALAGTPEYASPWMRREFLQRNKNALRGYPSRLKVFGPSPTFQENMAVFDFLRRQLACCTASLEPLHEKRYPYLDRNLLEFISAIPREQLVRPGQRRSLMRRALAGITPEEILNRKRKAFVAKAPLEALNRQWSDCTKKKRDLLIHSLGFVEADKFSDAIETARKGRPAPIVLLLRILTIESWLRNLEDHGLLESGRLTSPGNGIRPTTQSGSKLEDQQAVASVPQT